MIMLPISKKPSSVIIGLIRKVGNQELHGSLAAFPLLEQINTNVHVSQAIKLIQLRIPSMVRVRLNELLLTPQVCGRELF